MRKTLLIASLTFIGGYLIGKHKKKSFNKEQINDLQKENDWLWENYEKSIDENQKLYEEKEELWEKKENLWDENFLLDDKISNLEVENNDLKYELGDLESLINRYETCLKEIINFTDNHSMMNDINFAISKILRDNNVQFYIDMHYVHVDDEG